MAKIPTKKYVSEKYSYLFEDEYWNYVEGPCPSSEFKRIPARPGAKNKGTRLVNKYIPKILDSSVAGLDIKLGQSIEPNSNRMIGKYSIVLYEAEIIRASSTWYVSRYNKELIGKDDETEGWRNSKMNLDPLELISTCYRMNRSITISQLTSKSSEERSLPLTYNFLGAPGEVSILGENCDTKKLQRYIRAAGFFIALPTLNGKLKLLETAPVRRKKDQPLSFPIKLISNKDHEVLNNSSIVGQTNYRPADKNGKGELVSRLLSARVYTP